MKILTFTTLFPNTCQPRHGIFVEQRLRKLLKSGRVEAKVVAPVPWFPLRTGPFGQYSTYARVPRHEQRGELDVVHPRYVSIPKVGMSVAPLLLARAMRGTINRIIDEGYDFDLIDAHYYYPDGVAAAMLAQEYGKPVVITARGSDLNLFLDFRIPRQWIKWAEQRASATITVSEALKQRLVAQGVAEDRVGVLRNGVDLDTFHPAGRDAVREKLGVCGKMLLSVGNLLESKGQHIAIESITEFRDARLFVIGEGEQRRSLEELAASLGLRDRVTFVGNISQSQLREYYCAADALILMSAREGMPNVLLESMACGTPVIASNVGGVPEIVHDPVAGIVTGDRSVGALRQALTDLFSRQEDRAAVRKYAEQFSWDETTAGQIELFESLVAGANEARPVK